MKSYILRPPGRVASRCPVSPVLRAAASVANGLDVTRRFPIPLLVVALGAGRAVAQTAGGSQEAMLRKLLARAESLEAEVRQLRAGKAPASAASGKAMAPLEKGDVVALDDTAGHGTFPQVKFRGFADVDYHWADGGKDRNAFRLGQPDLFPSSQRAENLSVLSERRFIFNVPGAIGFVRAAEADATVKIVRVNGHAPGDPQYPLRLGGGP